MSKIIQVWKVNNYGKGVIDGSQDFFRITPDVDGVTPTVPTLQEVYNQGNTINEFTEEMEEYNLSLGVFNGNEFITQESISGVVIEDTTEFTLSTQKGQNKQSLNIVSQKINEDTLSSEVGGVSVTVGKVLLIEEKSNDNGTNRVKLGFENLDEPITGTQEWEWKIPKDEPQGVRKIATREWSSDNLQGKTIVVDASITAVNDGMYSNIANATYTDPSPVAGKGYIVFVRNGTATIGSVGYSAGNLVYRFFHSGSWGTTVYGVSAPINTATANRIVPSTSTATEIDFSTIKIFGTPSAPLTANLTNSLTGALVGVIQKIYHNNATAPTVPAGWILIGGSYATSELNIIYAEFVSGSRVEYWITQEQ
jgi:hypothetical protein